MRNLPYKKPRPEEFLDFISVGDVATDNFIRIKDAKVNCSIDEEKCQLCVAFGEKIPYEFSKVVYGVGNAGNAAVCAARLGLKSALISDLGDDEVGKIARESLRRNKVETGLITIHHNIPSNYHYVLWYESDRTILIKHQEFPYRLPEFEPPKWIYLTSLPNHSLPYHQEIERYLKNYPETKLAFQPGTFQIKLGLQKMKYFYERSSLFFCNVGEARKILGNNGGEVGELLKSMRTEGPKTVIITDGPKGAYAYDGKTMWFMPPFPDPKPPYERTGAGDAFSSTVASALILGKSLQEALRWGAINSAYVVQDIGGQAGLQSRKKIEELLKTASESFQPKKIL